MQVEKKKIVFVVPSLRGGGAEKVASSLFESMQSSAENIKLVLVLFERNLLGSFGQNVDIRYLSVSSNKNIIYTIKKFFWVIYRLSKIIQNESPCTILSFMDYSNVVSIIGNWLSGRKNKVIISVHILPTDDLYKYATDFWKKIMGVLIKSLYNKANSIIAVSQGVRNDLVENFRIDKRKIHVIHNPIDLNKIDLLSLEDVSERPLNEDIPIILSVGRLSKQKGFEYLLKAFSVLKGKRDARLIILGEGEEEPNLKELSKSLGVDEKVFFLGFKDNPYKYMKRSTIFVLSSLYEGFGIVIVEAMACGIPVIATKSYVGIEDIIEHEKNGLLVPVADENALAESILRLLDDMELRMSMSEEAKKNIRKFSIERITDQYKAVLGI